MIRLQPRSSVFPFTTLFRSPFAGPEAVLSYLARYTHRVAISNARLVGLDERGITFRYKDYRRNGRERFRTMTLAPDEFIDRKSTRLNSSHVSISYAVLCLKK